MSYTGTVENISTSNTTAAEVTIPSGSSNFTITVYAVDSAEAFASATSGTAALTVKAAGSTQYETVFQSDGTTAVSIDLTATSPSSITIENSAARFFKATPTSLAAANKIRLAVTHD